MKQSQFKLLIFSNSPRTKKQQECYFFHINIKYFLGLNFSGIPQGKLIKRQRLPKNDLGEHWHWKDFNLDILVTFYGKSFMIYDCNKWTEVCLFSSGFFVLLLLFSLSRLLNSVLLETLIYNQVVLFI